MCSNIQLSVDKTAKAHNRISKGPFVLDLNSPLTHQVYISNYQTTILITF